MNFVDNTGHIFSLPHFEEFPFGYEYNENPYTFWIDSPNSNRLSVGNYYMRPIYFLLPYNITDQEQAAEDFSLDKYYDIEITVDSTVYSLVSTAELQNQLNNFTNIHDKINLDLNTHIVNTLTNEDLYGIIINEEQYIDAIHDYINKKYILVPFYVVGNASEEGSWSTNVLIYVGEYNTNDEVDKEYDVEYYCPITVGGQWTDENEILAINAGNMGIKLPPDIMKAVYQASFENGVFNAQLWNEKTKEYLMNYMGIKGEIGNFNSAINSLNWFGYNDLIDISTLLRTDNEYKKQYVKDFFDINTDILESFNTFHNSALLSLVIKLNQDTEHSEGHDFSKDMWGEDNPILEDLMDKMVPVKIGKNEPMTYWRSYYNFSFIELGLKLSALKYYYDKYFLPIHMSPNSATLQYKVYANDLKLINKSNEHIVENIIFTPYKDEVKFPDITERLFTKQLHYVDKNYNEFEAITETDDWYFINDSCVNIPIEFKKYDHDVLYNCVLILEKLNTTDNVKYTSNYNILNYPDSYVIYESHFSFVQKAYKDEEDNVTYDPTTVYRDFIIYPKILTDIILKRDTNELYKEQLTSIYYWINSEFLLRLLVNNRWYTYKFTIKLPDLQINFGRLRYKYWEDENNFSSKFRQLKHLPENPDDKLVFNGFMYEPKLVEVNNINFFKDFVKYLKMEEQKYVSKQIFTNNSLIYYFFINGQKILINRDLINNHNTLYIPYKYLNQDNLYQFKYGNLTIFLNEEGNGVLTIQDIVENENYILVDENSYVDVSKYLILRYDNDKKQYYVIVDGEKVYIEMYELLYNTIENFLGEYKELKNIVNSNKYKNQLHIFDLYRRERVIDNTMWRLHNNIDVKCKSIRFIHKNYTNNIIYIQGITHDLSSKIDDGIRADQSHFNTHDDYTKYSIFWNDKLADYDKIDPEGYVYYIASDREGNVTTDYADSAITEGFDFIEIGKHDFNTYQEFVNFVECEVNGMIIKNEITKIIIDIPDPLHGFPYSEVAFKAKFKSIRQNGKIEYYDFVDIDDFTFKQRFIDNTDVNTPWKIEIQFYYKKYYTIQNIEIEYTGEVFKKYKELNGVNTDELEYYYGIIDEKMVKLTPYYDVIQYKDTTIPESEYDPDNDNFVLKNQPHRHWYNVDTYEFNVKLKDSIDQLWMDSSDLDEYSSHWEDIWSYMFEDDIAYKNYLEVDVSKYIQPDKWYTLNWEAKIQIGEENKVDWTGINLALYEIYGDSARLISNGKGKTFRVLDYNLDAKYVVFMQIDSFPGQNGQVFRATFNPMVCEVHDEYQRLKYDVDKIEDENSIEYNFRGKTYKYGMNNSKFVKSLYSELFKMTPYSYTKDDKTYTYDILSSRIDINTPIEYDQYLMHDNEYWYLVYISTRTLDHFSNISDMNINNLYNFDGNEIISDQLVQTDIDFTSTSLPLNIFNYDEDDNISFNENYDRKYQLRLISSNPEFLPNRYLFESTNGVNHFNSDDLIAAIVENNNRLPINIHKDYKWKISPYSIDVTGDAISESNAEMIILDAPKNKNKYDRGYYTVTVRYSASGYTNQQWKRNALIRID